MSEDKIEYDIWNETAYSTSSLGNGMPLYIPGVDVSKHQGMMDWKKCATTDAKYALMRCTVGAKYSDTLDPRFYPAEPMGENFRRNYDGATENKLPVSVYHVVVPRWAGKPVTADEQIDNLYYVLEDRKLDFPIILDCELTNGDNPRHITSVIEGCIERIEAEGDEVMIYTGAWWWDGNVMPHDKWSSYPLHVANYTSAAQPYMPRDWAEWDVWQWSADGNGKGHEYGADSDSIDLNRMKQEFWNKHIGEVEPPPVDPPASKVITLQQRAICGDDVYEGEAVLNIIDD